MLLITTASAPTVIVTVRCTLWEVYVAGKLVPVTWMPWAPAGLAAFNSSIAIAANSKAIRDAAQGRRREIPAPQAVLELYSRSIIAALRASER
jgi:hypothetical protein